MKESEFPIGRATSQAIVDFILEQKGMTKVDLYDVMGGKRRVSEFFSEKRELSINHMGSIWRSADDM